MSYGEVINTSFSDMTMFYNNDDSHDDDDSDDKDNDNDER
jgi:hypothetical protein